MLLVFTLKTGVNAMAGGRPKAGLELLHTERSELEALARRRKTAQAFALRARIVLACAEGQSNTAVAAKLGVSLPTVGKWRRRFVERRMEGLYDEPRSGAPRTVTDEAVAHVVTLTLESKPPHATHWSTRSLAAHVGMSQTAVNRIWRAFGLQPHRQETFKFSDDPQFVDKVRDVVGLYVSPPDHALVLSVDEKSQVQALDRSQPLLPMTPGSPERRTHDYYRHGTTSLFAALNVVTGQVIGQCQRRHRHQEFLKFLRYLDKTLPKQPGREIHLVMDNYATHKTPAVQRWFQRHPEYHVHFTPTGASWLNQVERFFAEITNRRIRRGVFRSVRALEQAIRDYLDHHNKAPRPFTWTADADTILQRVANVCKRINNSGH
jgi:transposase